MVIESNGVRHHRPGADTVRFQQVGIVRDEQRIAVRGSVQPLANRLPRMPATVVSKTVSACEDIQVAAGCVAASIVAACATETGAELANAKCTSRKHRRLALARLLACGSDAACTTKRHSAEWRRRQMPIVEHDHVTLCQHRSQAARKLNRRNAFVADCFGAIGASAPHSTPHR